MEKSWIDLPSGGLWKLLMIWLYNHPSLLDAIRIDEHFWVDCNHPLSWTEKIGLWFHERNNHRLPLPKFISGYLCYCLDRDCGYDCVKCIITAAENWYKVDAKPLHKQAFEEMYRKIAGRRNEY